MARARRTLTFACVAVHLAGCSVVTPLDDLTSGGRPARDAGAQAPLPHTDAGAPRGGGTGAPAAGDAGDALDASIGEGDAAIDAPIGTDAAGGADAGQGSPYRAVVLFDAPLGYWRLGEHAGSLAAADETGANRDGAYLGSVTFGVAGALVADPDTAATFDGSSASVQLTNDFDFPGTHPFSVEAWIRPTVRDTTYRHVITRETSDGSGRQGYALFLHQSVGLTFERFVNGSNIVVSAPFPPLGTYTHVVATYDGAVMSLYVDGAPAGSAPDGRSAVVQTERAFVGSLSPSTNPFSGSIDEPAIYGTALSPAAIVAHYHVGLRQ